MVKEKVILAYSGGLDTSVAITWLNKDYDVIAVCMDVGEGNDLDFIHDKALKVGAIESHVIDVKDEFCGRLRLGCSARTHLLRTKISSSVRS